jgi:hypothetical protein
MFVEKISKFDSGASSKAFAVESGKVESDKLKLNNDQKKKSEK